MNSDQLATHPSTLAVPELSVAQMLSTALASGITTENASALEKMLALYERMEDKKAEGEFARAFVKLQSELPEIQGSREIPDKSGKVKFRYANFEDIDRVVRPICQRNGFAYSFHESAIGDGRVTVVMTLMHTAGHSKAFPYSCRIGGGPPGANESQADGSGHTYAQRGAIEKGLSLRVVGSEKARDDARDIGAPISAEKATELHDRALKCGADVNKFLKFAQAEYFEEIGEAILPQLESMLRAKERAKQPEKPADTGLADKDLFQ